MSRGPQVSVVVTCHDLGAFLDEAVDSVLAQTVDDVEIVVVDDGSTDPGTMALLDAYNRPRTRVIRTGNRGLPAARNLGVSHASGDYLCMLDADDRLAPRYVERSLQAFAVDPSLAFVSHWLQTFGESNEEWRPRDCDLEALLDRNTVNGAALVRRHAFEAVGGFDEAMRDGLEDWDFWLRLVTKGYRGTIVPEVLHHYRRRAGSMSAAFGGGADPAFLAPYRVLVAKHAVHFAPRLPAMVAATERSLADLRRHVAELELDWVEWVEPERRAWADEVARLEQRPAPAAVAADRGGDPDAARRAAEAEVAALRASWSWRLTAPGRRVVDGWLALRRLGRR